MSGITKFDAEMISLRDLLGSHFHAIPDMQRNYEWDIAGGAMHGKNLWDNLVEFTDEDPSRTDNYYVGTMITYKEGTKWMVIDGQQRLTTLSIMFMAARDILDTAFKNKITGTVKIGGEDVVMKNAGKELAKSTVGTPKKPRLVPKDASQMNTRAYNGYLHPLGNRPNFPKKTRSKFKVVQAYEFFETELQRSFSTGELHGLQSMVEFLDHLLDGVVITRTIVKDLAHGYRIFSTENTTGLKLGSLDIVRALILAQIDRKKLHDHQDEIEGNLKDMMNNLEGLSKSDKNNFVRYVWIINKGTPMNKTRLINAISADIRSLDSGTAAKTTTKHLALAAEIYANKVIECNSKQHYYRAHRDLSLCGFKQYRPLLIALVSRKGVTKDSYKRIFGIIETLYVRFILVGRAKPSILEPNFASWSKQAGDKMTSVDTHIENWINDSEKLIEVFDFRESFQQLRIPDKKAKKYRYLLSLIEEHTDPAVVKSSLGTAVAEPVLPLVEDASEWAVAWPHFNKSHHAAELQLSIGNHVLLKTASGLTVDADWDKRSSHYSNKGKFLGTQQFANAVRYFDETTISQREQMLSDLASKIWALDRFKSP